MPNKNVRVAINGFGRIGRAAFKIGSQKNIDFVAINDLTDPKSLATLLKYDTVYGRYNQEVEFDENHLIVNGKKITLISEKDPSKLPWEKIGVDVVIESTGRFTKDGAAKAHLEAGAKKVVVSAPTKGSGGVKTYLKGVNHDQYQNDQIISNASCTTNCISPVINVLHSRFGVLKSLMNTIHSYTAEQNLVDGSPPAGHPDDLRRARAGAQNIVPTTTGAATATTKAIPELEGLFDGLAIRVPTITGSISNIVVVLKGKTTVEEINNAFKEAAKTPFYKGVLETTTEPLVSSDIIGSSASAIVDLSFTKVVAGDMVSVLVWYDNEWGYANRLIDMVTMMNGE